MAFPWNKTSWSACTLRPPRCSTPNDTNTDINWSARPYRLTLCFASFTQLFATWARTTCGSLRRGSLSATSPMALRSGLPMPKTRDATSNCMHGSHQAASSHHDSQGSPPPVVIAAREHPRQGQWEVVATSTVARGTDGQCMGQAECAHRTAEMVEQERQTLYR